MFDFIPDMATTYLRKKHSEFIKESLRKLLSLKNSIGKYEDKRILFIYCLVYSSKFTGMLEDIKSEFKTIIEQYFISNLLVNNEKLNVAYFLGSIEYKYTKVRINNIKNYKQFVPTYCCLKLFKLLNISLDPKILQNIKNFITTCLKLYFNKFDDLRKFFCFFQIYKLTCNSLKKSAENFNYKEEIQKSNNYNNVQCPYIKKK